MYNVISQWNQFKTPLKTSKGVRVFHILIILILAAGNCVYSSTDRSFVRRIVFNKETFFLDNFFSYHRVIPIKPEHLLM